MAKGKGVYHFKIDTKSFKATPYGDMAEGMEEVSAASMYELNKALVDVCKTESGIAEFKYENSVVTPKMALWTACIGTATIGGGGGGGGGAAPAAAAAGGAAAAAAAPEPEPEEE